MPCFHWCKIWRFMWSLSLRLQFNWFNVIMMCAVHFFFILFCFYCCSSLNLETKIKVDKVKWSYLLKWLNNWLKWSRSHIDTSNLLQNLLLHLNWREFQIISNVCKTGNLNLNDNDDLLYILLQKKKQPRILLITMVNDFVLKYEIYIEKDQIAFNKW